VSDELLVRDEGHVRVLTLNRPERRNALSVSLASSLSEESYRAGEDPEVWVVVIAATGGQAFCAGGDLKEAAEIAARGEPPPVPVRGVARTVAEVVLDVPKPTIAAIDGDAVGGGFELALACDLRVAARTARFGLPEAKRGMGANFGSVVLPRLVPAGVALELLYLGELVTAEDSARWGLVNRLVDAGEAESAALELAAAIAANAPLSLRRMKETFVKGSSLPLTAALRLDAGPDSYTSEDRAEGMAAFLEKRPPQWKNR
jgi:enoyl-CoA hydratase